MTTIIPFPKRNIQLVSTEELKLLWDAFDEDTHLCGDFWFEDVYWELNRRGEGRYCAV